MIIHIATDHTISCGLLLDLIERVVVNRTDQRLRLFRIGQGQFNSAQLPIRTVTETLDVTVGVSLHLRFALRVESPACLQAYGLQQCITIRLGKWPVRAVGRLQEVPFFAQRPTRQSIVQQQARACRIVMANQLIALVMLSSGRPAISEALGHSA